MLNKELLMVGSEKGQIKVRLTIGVFSNSFGSVYGYLKNVYNNYGSLDILPYWGTTGDVMVGLYYGTRSDTTVFKAPNSITAPNSVTVFVEGYTQGITGDSSVDGDVYSMRNSEGSTRYLTFDPPPPLVTWIQRHSNRSRNRVLCRRRSLGGAKC